MLVLCDPPALSKTGQWSTVSYFRDVPKDSGEENPSREQNTVQDIWLFLWFRRRNVFQVRVYIDEVIVDIHGL